jgi:hypothetical protein
MTKLCWWPDFGRRFGRAARSCFLVLCWLAIGTVSFAQMETATLSGTVMDHSGAVVADAQVQVTNSDTNVAVSTSTNKSGIYVVPSLRPGRYRIAVTKVGFKQVVVTDVILNVQDVVSRNFNLEVGAVSESITVTGDELNVNTTDATVSTVVDRQFAENLPMNGRSFQTLIQLTPGVVLTTSTSADSGQFSVNGQRANANYWTLDGVSANIGISPYNTPGNGVGGALGSFSAQGGTNSLVSVDALQEFRIQTSTYAPEFGRTPGGQISIVTRSGTNQFHGTLFDYWRNDVLDANDWFAGEKGLRKPAERQNDFGGTFSGPLLKDRTFFFFSYEGLRLRLPQVALATVPDVGARQSAMPAMQPYLNAYPKPNGPEILDGIGNPTGAAQFNSSFSNRSTLDAYSVRIDHRLKDKLALFARYNYSPSELVQRGLGPSGSFSLSTVTPAEIKTHTGTVGATWMISPPVANDLRFNYSRVDASSRQYLDDLGGAVPLESLPFPNPFTPQHAVFTFTIFSLQGQSLLAGESAHNLQRQFNLVDNLSVQSGSHTLKFGVDFRRLSPLYDPPGYGQNPLFSDVPSVVSGSLLASQITSGLTATILFHNLGVFAEDTWRVIPRLTVTYGLRWDVDFVPTSSNGPSLAAVTGFSLNNLSTLSLAPAGTPPYKTTYGNIAPRVGLAYELSQSQRWQTVLRGGFGVFFDLATQEVGNTLVGGYPFGANKFVFGGTFPLDSATAAPPPVTPASLTTGTLFAFDPHLKLPYTLQWNVAVEQALGREQALSASYIGSVGRRLLQTASVGSPNPSFFTADLVSNTATSDYDALQVQFQRRLSHGLQALASYTWSHSIDTGSAGSYLNTSNIQVPQLNPNENRGPSDFDIRNAFSAGVTYDIPFPKSNTLTKAILRGWSLESVVQARSAPPVDVSNGLLLGLLFHNFATVRPDVVARIPLYLYGAECATANGGAPCPGGKAINFVPGAVAGGCPDGSQSVGPFCSPPVDANGIPLRQGKLGRNALRGFGATQWDFAVHRDFPIHEALRLQFRAEMFNVLNHPNFGPPIADLSQANFGLSTVMLGRSLDQNTGGGGFSALYQIGGPRSVQLALKLTF